MTTDSETESPQQTAEQPEQATQPTDANGAAPTDKEGLEALAPPSDVAEGDEEVEAPTEPLPITSTALGSGRSAPRTTPLMEADAERLPLQVGAVVGERYEIEALLSAAPEVNVYRALDTQGYKRCWACGSTLSRQGDTYCADCGAELSDRRYRVQEFFTATQQEDIESLTLPLPAPILANRIPGVSQVYDIVADALGHARVYVVWEEEYGRTLASYMSDTSEISDSTPSSNEPMSETQSSVLSPQSSEEAGEEQIAAWMAQSAEVLSQLHAEGIVSCRMTLDNLVVHPGDRVVLLDPAGCREAPVDEEEAAREHLSDVRLLASELERWYIEVRDVGSILSSLDMSDVGAEGDDGEEGMLRVSQAVFGSPNVTGPLAAMLTPVFVLARAREGEYPTAEALAEALRDLYEENKPLTDLTLWSGRASDVGQVRQVNEDSVLTLEATVLEHEGNLPIAIYVIADGMGGHQSGEVASSIAARTVGAVVNSSLIGPIVAGDPVARDEATCANLLKQSVLEANRRIAELARERHSDLGTTLVAALVIGNQLTVANVGDSRAYLLRDNALTPLTTDHSLVMQLVLAGQIERDEIYSHPRRNEIYRALGDPRITEAEVDVYMHRLKPGDGLLLCSDGLWDFVRDPVIQEILEENAGDPQSISEALVAEANRQGGEDNISVVYARVMVGEDVKRET